jgi:hypothetical protein
MTLRRFLLIGLILALAVPASAQLVIQRDSPGITGDGTVNASQIKFPDGTSVAPSITFATETTLGFYRLSSGVIGFTGNFLTTGSGSLLAGSAGAQGFVSRTLVSSPADGQINFTNNGVTAGIGLDVSTDGTMKCRTRAQSGDCIAQFAEARPTNAQITQGAATGLTIVNAGNTRRIVYIATVDRTAFICAAVTCDVTIGTLPAKTILQSVYGDLTTTFACSATCTTATLSAVLGRGAGGAEFLASFDADASATQFGDADAELGTQMTRAAAIQGGTLSSWASTATVVMRLTSATGNIGTGAATNLSQGSVTFYLVTERLN